MKRKRIATILAVLTSIALCFCMVGCGGGTSASGSGSASSGSSGNSAAPAQSNAPAADKNTDSSSLADLKGKTLLVYCGAGMKDPFTAITDNFKAATGCDVNLTFGNGAQIQSQITTTSEGDLFIAGAASELKTIKEANMVTASKDLVQHIPVIAVPKGNPANIKTIADLGNARLVFGDAESTPIGKIADAVLSDAGLKDTANIIARTSTAPEMITALTTGEADAAIVWKENASGKEGIEIVDTDEMKPYIKTIPAASLSCSANPEALEEFLKYLDSDEAHGVWEKAGYVIV